MHWKPTVYVIAVVVVACSVCRAQPAAESDADTARVDFAFPGGTVAEYVEAVRQAAPELNVVLHPEAEEVKLPRVVLKNVPAEALLTGGLAGFEHSGRVMMTVGRLEHGVFHIMAHLPKPEAAGPPPQMAVFDLADIVVSGPADPVGRDEVAQKLQKIVAVNFEDNTLFNVLEYFRNQADINIAPRWQALQVIGIEQDAPVTLQLKDVSVDVALRIILDDLNDEAYYTIDEGVVRIRGDRRPPQDRRITIEQLLTAVETALEMVPRAEDPAEEPAELKYHADTGLLIVRGYEQQLHAVESVISAVGSRVPGAGRGHPMGLPPGMPGMMGGRSMAPGGGRPAIRGGRP